MEAGLDWRIAERILRLGCWQAVIKGFSSVLKGRCEESGKRRRKDWRLEERIA